MKQLKRLMAAGYRHGYTNDHGADGTVSSLEWALQHLESDPDTAQTYSANAASDLESRLFAAYVVRCMAFINQGQLAEAQIELQKAESLAALTRQSHGKIQGIGEEVIEQSLAVLERRLRQARL